MDILLVFIFICSGHVLFSSSLQNVSTVVIDVDTRPMHEVDERFLSVTIGSGSIKQSFRHLDFKSTRFVTLANGLNSKQKYPEIYLRVGGSNADDLMFIPSAANQTNKFSSALQVYKYNFTSFAKLYRFASNMHWRMIFDLNSLIRNEDGTWNPENAIDLIKEIKSRNYSVDYELGNEPDLYPTHRNITIPPEQLAKDFKTLKNILSVLTHGDSKLYGPDMATLERYEYFHKFLTHVEEGVLDFITFHHYYSTSTNVTVKNFTSVEYLDRFLTYVNTALNIIKTSITTFPHPPIRIGETSSTYDGGNPDIGESFAAGFLWLDKLGLAAQLGIDTVMRQSLKGGHYSLVNKEYYPCIDYWTSVLYKELVGTKVLRVTGFSKYNRTVRVYAHCINKNNKRSYPVHNTIVLLALNLNERVAEMALVGPLSDKDVDGFIFTPGDEQLGLSSKMVKLNGHVLKMVDDEELPELKSVRMMSPLSLPPLSYGFFVVKNVESIQC